ncbi:MAG: co-chaperone GroES, partial [Candidatus Moranbacteria bacterium]|nr:co-chaperone GroES [Candidatus Moranbacteria bacterium]
MEGNIKIRPLFDNVVIKEDEIEEKSKTGIIITGSDNNPALVGTVISVGKEIDEEIKVGDRIMYAPFSGRELGGFLLLA